MPAWIEDDRKARGWYQVRWREGGKKRASKVFTSKPAAEAFKRHVDDKLAVKRDVSRAGSAGPTTIAGLLQAWREDRIGEGKIREPYADEVQAYVEAAAETMKWTSPRHITGVEIDKWLKSGDGRRGKEKALSSILSVLNWAKRPPRRWPVDPDALIRERRDTVRKPAPPLLTEAEVETIINRAFAMGGHRVALLLHCLATYGWRPKEGCTLRVRNFAKGLLKREDTKNKDTVEHPLTPAHEALIGKLTAERDRDAFVFLDPWERPWRLTRGKAEGLSSWYKTNVGEPLYADKDAKGRPIKGTGKGLTGVYRLKDYAISRMDALGIDDKTKAGFTGHKDLDVYDRYRATNSQKQATALDRL